MRTETKTSSMQMKFKTILSISLATTTILGALAQNVSADFINRIEAKAVACRERKLYRQAEAMYDRALALWKSSPALVNRDKEHDVIADNREGLAIVLTESGDYKRAAEVYKQVVAHREKMQGPKDVSVSISMRGYAEVLTKLNRTAEANALYEKADKIMPNMCGTPALNSAAPPPAPAMSPAMSPAMAPSKAPAQRRP